MNLSDFKKHKDWVKVWSGRWSLHFDSHIGNDWSKNLTIAGKPVFPHVIYFYTNGITDCWVSQLEKDDLGERFNSLVRDNPAYLEELPKTFRSLADTVTAFLNSHDPKKITPSEFREYWNLISKYYLPHLSVKYIVDYLSPEILEKHLPALEGARLYAEPIFRNTENFLEAFVERIGKAAGYTKEMILATLAGELDSHLEGKPLPEKSELQNRYNRSALLVKEGGQELVGGDEVGAIEAIVHPRLDTSEIKGQIAYKGKAKGKVRIVVNPREVSVFDKGDILVTGMTRPEFLPLMEKAAAFVTDAGGILSHAAIVARDMRKPCVIGTHVATKVLKDGDVVEVDADKGIVKIMK